MAQIIPRFQAFDDSGDPLSGGKLYTYEAGNSTNKATYSDPGLTTPNANPVVLDSRGEAAIFGNGTYKLILKTSADVTLWSQDDVEVPTASLISSADGSVKIQCEETAAENVIRFDIDSVEQLTIQDGKIEPTTDNDIDLGSATKEFKDAYIDGTANLDTAIITDLTTTNATLTNLILTNLLGHALPGLRIRPKFSWKDGDEIYIDPGMYHHQGTAEQFVYWDSQITFVLQAAGSNALSDDYGADGWHYIYLDDSAIVTQASPLLDAGCFLNETTAPTWTVAKHGWYNGNDRCIFACYETGGVILEFLHDGGDYVQWAGRVATWGASQLTASFADVTALRAPGFSTKAQARLGGLHVSTNTELYYRTKGQTDSTGIYVLGVNAAGLISDVVMPVFMNSSQVIQLKEAVNGTNTYALDTIGWYFPVGM